MYVKFQIVSKTTYILYHIFDFLLEGVDHHAGNLELQPTTKFKYRTNTLLSFHPKKNCCLFIK